MGWGRGVLLFALLFLPCACGGQSVGSSRSGDPVGTGGTSLVLYGNGGTTTDASVTELGAGGGFGQAVSAGTVTIQISAAPSRKYCSMTCGPAGPQIDVLDSNGNALQLTFPLCQLTACPVCGEVTCSNSCQSSSTQIGTVTLDWNGAFIQTTPCSNHRACGATVYAPPGNYVARFCSEPGTVSTTAVARCDSTGPGECVDVPFQYPSTTVVTGTLGCVPVTAPCTVDADCCGAGPGGPVCNVNRCTALP